MKKIRLKLQLLIAPKGIEINRISRGCYQEKLLIAPKGIEMPFYYRCRSI